MPRALLAPAVVTLFLWMIVPLVMTIYFSLIRYNLMQPGETGFIGLANYEYFVTDPSFGTAVVNTLLLLGSVIAITVVGRRRAGAADRRAVPGPRRGARAADLAVLRDAHGQRAAVEAHDDEPDLRRAGAGLASSSARTPVDWLTDCPLFSVIIMVAWQWLPFATLIFITALQSLNREQMEAARHGRRERYLQQFCASSCCRTWAARSRW